jgi:ribosomal protein L15
VYVPDGFIVNDKGLITGIVEYKTHAAAGKITNQFVGYKKLVRELGALCDDPKFVVITPSMESESIPRVITKNPEEIEHKQLPFTRDDLQRYLMYRDHRPAWSSLIFEHMRDRAEEEDLIEQASEGEIEIYDAEKDLRKRERAIRERKRRAEKRDTERVIALVRNKKVTDPEKREENTRRQENGERVQERTIFIKTHKSTATSERKRHIGQEKKKIILEKYGPYVLMTERLNAIPEGTNVTIDTLIELGLVDERAREVGVRIRPGGKLRNPVNIVGLHISPTAAEKVVRAGGTLTDIPRNSKQLDQTTRIFNPEGHLIAAVKRVSNPRGA